MIEATKEMLDAALDAHDDVYDGQRDPDAIQAGLVAVLAIVERDYEVHAYCNAELVPGVACKESAIITHNEHKGVTSTGNRVSTP